jgi:multidrug efflux pump subunit AcrA (membrane-fusion protein)
MREMKTIRLTLLLAAAAALAACGARPADPPSATGGPSAPAANGGKPGAQGGRRIALIPVQAVGVIEGPLVAENNTAGSVVPVTQSTVASQVAGVVLRVLRQAGEWVKEGQTIVQMDDSQLALSVRSAEAALASAKINYEIAQDNTSSSNPTLTLQVQSAQSTLAAAQRNYDSQKALFDLGGISASQLDSARSQLEQAQANVEAAKSALDVNQKSDTQSLAQLRLAVDQASNALELAQLSLRNAAIKAPFAGQLAAVNASPGMFVSQNTPVFTIVSEDRQISFNVSPSDAPSLPLGATVRFTYSGKGYPVRVRQAPSAPINGVVPMTAEVPRSLSLPYGAVGTVTYSLTLAHGALVPIASLNTSEDKNYVFVVADGKAVMQPVVILEEAGITAAVAGLTQGTQVIVNAPPGLLPGSAVQIVSLPGQGGPRAPEAGMPAGAQGQGGPRAPEAGMPAGAQGQGGAKGAENSGAGPKGDTASQKAGGGGQAAATVSGGR